MYICRKIHKAPKGINNRTTVSEVLIDQLRCQILPFSKIQGFSGKPIEHFPPYNFFTEYFEDHELARIDFYNWMHYCLFNLEGWKIPKEDGGWKNGSLHKLITKLHQDNNIHLIEISKANPELVCKAIHTRVDYYLSLLVQIEESIGNGNPIEPIYCSRNNDEEIYIIFDGHHRAAAIKSLGVTHINIELINNRNL